MTSENFISTTTTHLSQSKHPLFNLSIYIYDIVSSDYFIMTVSDFYSPCIAPSGAFKYFLDGQWLESSSGKTVKIMNPTTNAPAYEVQGRHLIQMFGFSFVQSGSMWIGYIERSPE